MLGMTVAIFSCFYLCPRRRGRESKILETIAFGEAERGTVVVGDMLGFWTRDQ